MEYTLNSLTNSKDEKEYPELSEKCQSCLNRAKELKNRSDTRTSELRDIRFQWEMFESRFTEMIQWLERTRENLILPLKEKDEDSIEFVLGKLLKVREIEKKLAEKVAYMKVV
jgi:tRNA U54 and U55 pseudouridine synthase Pus10